MLKKLLDSIVKGWVTEYKFDSKRRWRFDYSHLKLKIGIEIEGGVWISGRHNRGKGFIADLEKYNQAQLQGWKVLRYTPQQVTVMLNDIDNLVRKYSEMV